MDSKPKTSFLLALVVLLGAATSAPAVWVGDPAPAVSVKTLDGQPLSMEDFKGKQPVLLVFWATWCPICRHEVPKLNQIQAEFGPRGLAVLGVNVGVNDSVRKAKAYAEELGISYPLAFDDGQAMTRAFGVSGTPTVIIVDRGGTVRYRAAAVPDDLAEHFESLLR